MFFPYVLYTCSSGQQLEINSAATATYVENNCDTCGAVIRGTFSMNCNCDPLYWTHITPITAITYSTPAVDGALWYSAGVVESHTFLGYHVRNVTRPNQMARTVTQRLGRAGGGVLGPLNRGVVRLDFQVLLFACDDPGMEYGFRFLSNQLACAQTVGDGSTECSRGTLVYRNTCQDFTGTPTEAATRKGMWRVSNAVLVSGPVWSDDPLPGMRRYVRQAEFSIAGEVVSPVAWTP